MGQFNVNNNFWFSIFSYPWTWDLSLPPTASILQVQGVSVYVCLTNKDITNLEGQPSLNLVSPSQPFFCTHHALHELNQNPTQNVTKPKYHKEHYLHMVGIQQILVLFREHFFPYSL